MMSWRQSAVSVVGVYVSPVAVERKICGVHEDVRHGCYYREKADVYFEVEISSTLIFGICRTSSVSMYKEEDCAEILYVAMEE
jgi:hypothetical protein